jgi:predicted GNAT family N-acyltransferase
MNPSPKISVRPADWFVDREILRAIREEVFVREQLVPADMEWDEYDEQSHHVVAMAGDTPIGTGRLLADGHIGRMAVLKPWRGKGAGSALLANLVDVARGLGMRRVVLNAQIQAMPFYVRHGFQAEGEAFLDAGIPHRRMERDL